MKMTAMGWVALTTFLLLILTLTVLMDLAFNWVFYITVLGQLLVGVMVYRVLRDPYTSDKTFDDFYEDFPISRE
ncbi:hypothetical protein [Robiginitalea sp. SC105]|uniref:hypothetical protein n=1 Tax=Robiginitalea sp. SC105 TaxID=2762332 RepID=UPI001639F2CB|nr:hypothetical protein [Robiginitalea sp. SC105]MBC2838661.1 hypothetical protein [Robiginitalea sp. SC105]